MGCTPCEENARRAAAEAAANRPEMVYVVVDSDQHELARFGSDEFDEALEFQADHGGSVRLAPKDAVTA